MKKILIAGGTGFIGSNLCKKLIEDKNNEIICVDNNCTGSVDNIKEYLDNPRFKYIEHDIIEPLEINEKIDEIYNLACPASPVHYQKDPIKTTKTSVLGIINMLELAKKYNSKILQASTSEVYGEPYVHPQVETYWGNVNPIGIRSCYDEGKRCAETLMMDYHKQYGVDIRIVRIFNTYGPNMDPQDGRVVSNFIIQALKNEDITIYGDGSQTRSFCYISDIIEGIIRMMNKPKGFIGPINLGNPSERTILDFAKLITQKIETKSNFIFKELPSDDPTQRRPDISLAEKELDWIPQIDIEEGLEKTINCFIKRLEQYK